MTILTLVLFRLTFLLFRLMIRSLLRVSSGNSIFLIIPFCLLLLLMPLLVLGRFSGSAAALTCLLRDGGSLFLASTLLLHLLPTTAVNAPFVDGTVTPVTNLAFEDVIFINAVLYACLVAYSAVYIFP